MILTTHLVDKDSVKDTPEQYIQALLRKPLKEIGALRMALNSKPVGFVNEFVSRNGLDIIKDLLWDSIAYFVLEQDFNQHERIDHPFTYYQTKKSRDSCEKLSNESILCIKPLIKLQDILKMIIIDDVLLTLFCLYTSFGSYVTRKIACETLTVILYFDQSLIGKIIQCFSNATQIQESIIRQHFKHPLENQTNMNQIVKDANTSNNPFELWINSFDNVLQGRGILGSKVQSNLLENMSEDQLNDFSLSNWILINGFLRVPSSIPLRIHIRNLFLSANLNKILDGCQRMNNELIGWQLKQYHEDNKLDLKWFNDMNQLKMQDFQDPAECLDYLLRQTQKYPSAYFYLTKLMQLLTLIRDDPEQSFDVRHQYLRLISTLVEKIVLDNQGIDPNFTDLYGVSVASIIDGLGNQDKVENLQNQLKDAELKLKIKQQHIVKDALKQSTPLLDDGNKLAYIQQIDHLTDLLNISQGNTDQLQEQLKEMDDKYRNVLKNHDAHLDTLLKALKESNDLSQLDKMTELLNKDFATSFPTIPAPNNQQMDSLKSENARLRDQLKILRHRQTAIAPLEREQREPHHKPLDNVNISRAPHNNITEVKLKKISPLPDETTPIQAPNEPAVPGAGPPPPPPPPMSKSLALTKKYEPKTQLKQLNWEKIPEHATRDTIFGTLNLKFEDDLSQHKVFDEMEEMFGTRQQGMSRSASNNDEESVGGLFVSPQIGGDNHQNPRPGQEISVLDVKKAYNVNIMLQRMSKVTAFEIKQAVVEINKDILNPLLIQQLNKFMPSSKEIGKLQAYKHNKTNLSKADLFFIELLSIPRFQKRLELIEFSYLYQERHQDIVIFVDALNKGCSELRDSKSFKKILEMVLALGNFMNNGFRGGAYGFKITSLNKLADTKSFDNQTTLLHFLAKLVKTKYPEALGFINEFNCIHDACRIDMAHTKLELRLLRKGLSDLSNELDILAGQSDFETYKNKMSDFYNEKVKQLNILETDFYEADKLFKQTCKLFGEQASKLTCEEFFGIFSTFKVSFEVNTN